MTGRSFTHATRGSMTPPQCEAAGCENAGTAATAIGRLCRTHASRHYRHGKLEIENPRRSRQSPREGEEFGLWTVKREVGPRRRSGSTTRVVECVCRCGKERFVELRSLLNSTSTSCGCSSTPAEDRFWKNVKRGKPNECWPYGGSTSYGKVRLGGKRAPQMAAHRYSYMVSFGHVPPSGLVVMHKCDNPKCVNPNHLMLGTHADNAADMMSKGRWRGGFLPGPDARRRRKNV